MKKWRMAVCALLLCSMAAVGFAAAELPPRPTRDIYAQDYAGVLSAETKREINRAGQALREKTKAQIVVVTVRRLENTSPEEYALGILRDWGVGDKALNNGVVMLVAVEDRRSRIEVGYGLEGALPDGKTGEIQDRYMLPYFQAGDYSGGVLNGYRALAQATLAEYGQAAPGEAPLPAAAAAPGGVADTLLQYALGAGVLVLVVLDFMFFGGRMTFLLLSLLTRRGGGGGGGFGGGSGGGGGSSRRW